jgi:hypothetical protein
MNEDLRYPFAIVHVLAQGSLDILDGDAHIAGSAVQDQTNFAVKVA